MLLRRIFISVIITLIASAVFAQSFTVNFKADKLSGCDTLRVKFTDLTTSANSISWQWDFGDNTSDTARNPIHFYSSPGIYTVKLKVLKLINGIPQASQATKEKYITVTAPPNSYFTVNDSTFNNAFSIIFNGKVPADTTGLKFIWDFGDSVIDTGYSVIHNYPAEGKYDVKLLVVDKGGCKSDTMQQVTVENRFLVPNIFSPNNDGMNDEFVIISNGAWSYTLQVFDRWGNFIYNTTAKNVRWDGRNTAGVEMVPGTYYYILSSKDDSGLQQKTGTIELVR